jgi:ATP-dependent helicase/DNAse subunit B
MTFAEEKEALKKKIKEDMNKKKVVKYKKLPKDILNDPKAPTLDTP